MCHRFLIGVAICFLTVVCGGCARHRPVTAQVPSAETPSKPVTSSLSEYIRTVLRVSSENTGANSEALAELHQRRPELAELALHISSNPDNLEAVRALAQAYLEEGLYVNALQLFQQLQLQVPEDAGANLGLAVIWEAWKDYGLALQYAARAATLDPLSSPALEALGRIYLRRNERDAALRSFVAALEITPDKSTLLANAGYLYMLRGDWEDARSHLERAVEIDGSTPEVRNHLGIVLARLGDGEEAIRQFMAANDPAAAYNNLGVAYLGLRKWDEARQAFRRALTIDPEYVKAERNLREAESHLAPPANYTIEPFPAVSAPRVELAGTVETGFPRIDPLHPLSLSDYTRNLFRVQEFNAREARLAELRGGNPEFVELIRRVNENIAPGEIATAEALRYFRQISLPLVMEEDFLAPTERRSPALAEKLPDTRTEAMRAVNLERELRVELPGFLRARRAAEEENAWALAREGQTQLEQGEFEKARESFRRALQLDGSIPEARNNLGVALAQLGDRKGALMQFLTVSPPAEAHHHLGLVYASQKKWREASEELNLAVKIDPEYSEARVDLRKVETHLPAPAVYAIQVFSVRNEAAARNAGEKLAQKAGITPAIERADLNDKGVWYRARFHGYSTFRAALSAAKKMLLAGLIREYWIAPVRD